MPYLQQVAQIGNGKHHYSLIDVPHLPHTSHVAVMHLNRSVH
jgi:hypothetical protein